MNTDISGQPQPRRALASAAFAASPANNQSVLDRRLSADDGRHPPSHAEGRPQAFIIEVEGIAAGLALVHRGGFTFSASDIRFQALDGAVFRRIEQVSRAAREHLRALDAAPQRRRSATPWQRPGLRRAM